jgi:hypothetical protein
MASLFKPIQRGLLLAKQTSNLRFLSSVAPVDPKDNKVEKKSATELTNATGSCNYKIFL